MNRFEQDCVVEWLRQKLYRPVTHRLDPHPCVTMGCDEDDRYAASVRLEFCLQFDAGHTRHPNICDQAPGLLFSAGRQEFLSGAETNRG